ncbi:hypothetical protein DL991_29155 [Amycolatopsis sp. WAC 01375]|uniref:hypothetical protein n=1 Tax=Amycolatopsis sp. WAC 01375 TaxID=2203194 RepID=UPI000F7BAEDA|nr:hypothetical protein [Amycolatopsis sp. WAC 01375]RSM74726.1 hypothetical protein DL991_29155 [Amycolatopsis sp. WAC 01375]
MNNFDKLVANAAMYLGWYPRKDPVLEGIVRRIQELHTKDHLDAAAIAKMLTGHGKSSPLRREDFIQFVIDRT